MRPRCTALVIGALLSVQGCSPDVDPQVAAGVPAPEACASCHAVIAAEWEASSHARAWTSEAFRGASLDYTRAECLGCHAPQSLLVTEGRPALRDDRREDGVDCQACHDHGCGRASEGGAERHPVSALHRSPELCGRCHGRAWEEYQTYAAEGTPTCQECHMPAVRRNLTQPGGVASALWVYFQEPVEQRRHTFHLRGVEWSRRAVDLRFDTRRRGEVVEVEVDLTCRLPHHLPTGEQRGAGAIRLRVEGRDAQGADLVRAEEQFARDGTALVPGETWSLREQFPADVVEVVLRLERLREGQGPLVLITETARVGR
jgi:Cytochrome c554 and c-prime